jgi:glycosyltransferase involved in cell wall biosynthesis
VRSLYAQTLPDFEIIIVDDNEQGNRVRLNKELADMLTDPRIRLVEHDCPRNAASARNCGLRISRGQWITYLDDDDAYHPTKLEKQFRAAQETALPLGVCGMAINLHGRRRLRQVENDFFAGSALLLGVIPDTKVIFHRRAESVFFNEELDAAEDAYLFHSLVRHFALNRVFNIAEPLVEVYPQPGARVNSNGQALRKTCLAIYQEFGPAFGEKPAKVYLARAELQYCKFQTGDWLNLMRLSVRLLKLSGPGELRAVLNTALFKIPPARRFLVS